MFFVVKYNVYTFFNGCILCFSVDASNGDGYGRMVNDKHGSKSNCRMKKYFEVDGSFPKLGLFAIRNIGVEEELRYDYGVSNLPWRKMKVIWALYQGFVHPIVFIS